MQPQETAISESRKEWCVKRKFISPLSKSLPVATETGAIVSYVLIERVTACVQPQETANEQVQ